MVVQEAAHGHCHEEKEGEEEEGAVAPARRLLILISTYVIGKERILLAVGVLATRKLRLLVLVHVYLPHPPSCRPTPVSSGVWPRIVNGFYFLARVAMQFMRGLQFLSCMWPRRRALVNCARLVFPDPSAAEYQRVHSIHSVRLVLSKPAIACIQSLFLVGKMTSSQRLHGSVLAGKSFFFSMLLSQTWMVLPLGQGARMHGVLLLLLLLL